MSYQPAPKPRTTPAPLPQDERPRKRRGFLLPLLLLLLLLVLLFAAFSFFANRGKGGQTGTTLSSTQITATAAAQSQASANSSASLTATAATGSQGTNSSATATANARVQSGSTLPVPAFNNAAVRDDNNGNKANFDGSGESYSTEALQAQKIVPGQPIVINGVSFKWPDVPAGKEDNYQASGQVIPVTPVNGATVVAFLGASSNGPSTGKGTLTYTDGTTQVFDLRFTDWTTREAKDNVSFDNHLVVTMPYRNKAGNKEVVNTYLFSNEIALPSGKTIRSVTLPTSTDKGQLHVFAVATR